MIGNVERQKGEFVMIGNGGINVYPGQFGAPSTPVGPNGGVVYIQGNHVDDSPANNVAPDYIALAQANGGVPVFDLGPNIPLNATPDGQAVQPAHLPADSVVRKIDFNY